VTDAARPDARSGGDRRLAIGYVTSSPRNLDYRIGKLQRFGLPTGAWLDCGCGDGSYASALLDAGAQSVLGIDSEQGRISRARERHADRPGLSFEVAGAEALPVADASLDGVLLNEVLEHLPDELRSLAEIRRVLRPGGHLVVMSPNRLFPFEGHGMRLGPLRTGTAVPLLPWLPLFISDRMTVARNYWPWELRNMIAGQGFDIVATESVFPVLQTHPWLPGPLDRWYWRNLRRIERAPILSRFGVSTFVLARKATSRDQRLLHQTEMAGKEPA
jgi:SAM-dependent methyltransferase